MRCIRVGARLLAGLGGRLICSMDCQLAIDEISH